LDTSAKILDNRLPIADVWMVEDDQPGRPPTWIEDNLTWCGKDLKAAALMTSGRIVWRKLVTSANDPRYSRDWKKRRSNKLIESTLLTSLLPVSVTVS